jgi:hypothetical protein
MDLDLVHMEQTWLQKTQALFVDKKEAIWATVLTLLLGGSLTALAMVNQLVSKTGISSIIWLAVIIVLNILAITGLGYLSGIGKGERFLLISTLSAIALYIFLYFLRLSESRLELGGTLALNTRLLGSVAILGIYGVTVFYLLRHEVLPFFLRAAVAFLVILSTFSFFSFVSLNSRTNTPFTQDILNLLINKFSPIPWLILGAAALAFVSRADLNFRQLKAEIPVLLNLFAYYFVILLGVFFLSISSYGVNNIYYWQQSFIAFIAWDFVYRYTRIMYDDENHTHGFRLAWKDLVYYSILIGVVLLSSILLSYFPTR